MSNQDLVSQYKRNAINTADQGTLIIMMYEGAIKAVQSAHDLMHFSTYDQVNVSIQKAVNIIDELRLSLDLKAGEIAKRLEAIYIYVNELLVKANLNKDKKPLIEVKDILNELLSSWRQISKTPPSMSKPAVNAVKRPPLSGGFSITG